MVTYEGRFLKEKAYCYTTVIVDEQKMLKAITQTTLKFKLRFETLKYI